MRASFIGSSDRRRDLPGLDLPAETPGIDRKIRESQRRRTGTTTANLQGVSVCGPDLGVRPPRRCLLSREVRGHAIGEAAASAEGGPLARS
jgi:hypothetical protein